MEAHKEAIMDLVRQLTIHQFEYDEKKARLDDLLDQQASRAPVAAPVQPAAPANIIIRSTSSSCSIISSSRVRH
jgi:hypothetical protein